MTVPYDIMSDVLAVLTRISNGKVPTVACDEQGLSYSTFVAYTTRYPHLARLRTEAEDRLYDQMAEALPKIYDHPIYGVDDPKMAGVVSGNIKWLLSRRRRDAYGDHSTVEHKLTADREVLDALQKAKARAQGGLTIANATGATEIVSQALTIDADVQDVEFEAVTRSAQGATPDEQDLTDLY